MPPTPTTYDLLPISELDVEVQRKLPRMRPQSNRIDLILPLVIDPRVDQILCENVAFEEKVVVFLQGVEDDIERAGKLLDLPSLLRLELVQIHIHRLAWIELVPNTIKPRHQAGGECEVRIGRGIRSPKFDPLRLFGLRVHRDANAGRA